MENIPTNCIYEHFKGGKYYVLSVAQETTNARLGAKVVIYVSLTYGILKVRDLSEFIELVEWPDGERRPRFIPAE